MKLKISKNSLVLLMVSFVFLLTVSQVSAQCGPDGTQPCPKTTPTTKTKPKTTNSSSKTKPTPAKPVKTNQAINKNPLFKKLLGTWELDPGETIVFLANGTGKGYDKNELCANIKFSLKGSILELSATFVGRCLEKMGTSTETRKARIRFDENNSLWMRTINPDGTEDSREDSAKRIK